MNDTQISTQLNTLNFLSPLKSPLKLFSLYETYAVSIWGYSLECQFEWPISETSDLIGPRWRHV